VKLSGIAYESLVNGPGVRRVLFSQGCRHNCKGCFNPDTHCFNGGREFNADDLVEDILKNPMLKGVTFSGGDPLEQADKFAYIAAKLKRKGLSIWSYTGYTFEYIKNNAHKYKGWEELLKSIDVLVDGRFEIEEKTRAAIIKKASYLKNISGKRIRVELNKLITSKEPYKIREDIRQV
jgi:anaerobic ribonucleoside-triphosphate reductase activating protein